MTDPLEKQIAGMVKAARHAGKVEGLQAHRGKVHPANLVGLSAVVVVLVAMLIAAGFIIWSLMSGNWCDAAVDSDRAVRANNMDAARACVGLLMEQLKTLGTALLSIIAAVAIGFIVLVVLLIADGKVSFSASRSGVSGNIAGRGDTPPPAQAAAEQVAEAANEEAADIAEHGPRPAGD